LRLDYFKVKVEAEKMNNVKWKIGKWKPRKKDYEGRREEGNRKMETGNRKIKSRKTKSETRN